MMSTWYHDHLYTFSEIWTVWLTTLPREHHYPSLENYAPSVLQALVLPVTRHSQQRVVSCGSGLGPKAALFVPKILVSPILDCRVQ